METSHCAPPVKNWNPVKFKKRDFHMLKMALVNNSLEGKVVMSHCAPPVKNWNPVKFEKQDFHMLKMALVNNSLEGKVVMSHCAPPAIKKKILSDLKSKTSIC